jgi:hypothetical protein
MRTQIVLLALCLAATACKHVAPYDRALLAHPTMNGSDGDGPAAGHVRAVHEGATGGGSVAESGCGCN